jgi:hypothetical protein
VSDLTEIELGCHLPKLIDCVGAIGNQAAAIDVDFPVEDRWKLVLYRERDDPIAVHQRSCAHSADEPAIAAACERRHSAKDRPGDVD